MVTLYQAAPWALFILFIIGALALDLVILSGKDKALTVKDSLRLTGFWVSLAMVFCVGVYYFKGAESALMFLTGYIIEESLSVDNLFVFILIFSYFKIPPKYQPRILFWGILGAIVMRLVFILAGIALIQSFHWVIYVFGAFLVYTGAKLTLGGEMEVHPEKNKALLLFRKFMPVTNEFHDGHFITRINGVSHATPMLVALILIETSDVIFAVDSVPAILAITQDPFIVYTSNIFAILGLRSLFFALSGIMQMFRFLNYGLTLILVFLGIKMILSDIVHIPVVYSLGAIAVTLVSCIAISLLYPENGNK